MNWIVAGLLASAAAFAANRFVYRVWRDVVLLGPVPLLEEVAKTMAAQMLGASILYTHVVFGLTEAILDWRGRRRGLPAAVSALLAHSIFGLLTVAVARSTGNLGAGIVAAFLGHAVWNAVMLFRSVKR
ncbi:hypothetical protein [Dethiobacter alkaliphilus]|uniref:Abortive infection protein n=2 Tax=Dethiobacter TaxID=427925 RepID=C0GJD3_DETAL|nr:hypothetical protein [Dethiobacter alkaliphilus]EEG76618.1 conserved hypothetical protein [Dethiobacter alkaliphilus AHT 1]MCW3489126.1 hypothetical protein [Dethiobacter alkaliphilus]